MTDNNAVAESAEAGAILREAEAAEAGQFLFNAMKAGSAPGMSAAESMTGQALKGDIAAEDFLKLLPEERFPENCRSAEERMSWLYQRAGLDGRNKNEIFQIKYLIRLAFSLRLSYGNFMKLAEFCGYKCEVFFPPCYLLHKFLKQENYDIEKYREELLNRDNVRSFIKRGTVVFARLDKAFVDLFYSRCREKYMAPLDELKDRADFQTDCIRAFFDFYYL